MKTRISIYKRSLNSIIILFLMLPLIGLANNELQTADPCTVCFKILEVNKNNHTVIFNSFSILKDGDHTIISWSTSMELDNQGFTIERSLDSEDWDIIALVKGQAKSCDYVDYQFKDMFPENGTNFYRVKQLDSEGRMASTEVKSLFFEIEKEHSLRPVLALKL